MEHRCQNDDHVSSMTICSLGHETHVGEQQTEFEGQDAQDVAENEVLDQYLIVSAGQLCSQRCTRELQLC